MTSKDCFSSLSQTNKSFVDDVTTALEGSRHSNILHASDITVNLYESNSLSTNASTNNVHDKGICAVNNRKCPSRT